MQKWHTHFVYGLGDDSMREALRHYQEWFLSHRIPERSMFFRIHQHLTCIGAFILNRMGRGRLRSVNTPDLEEWVLCYMEEKLGLIQGGLQLQRKPPQIDLNSYTVHTIKHNRSLKVAVQGSEGPTHYAFIDSSIH
jgi:hypothetical protein